MSSLLAGVALFLYLAGAVVERVPRGVVREHFEAGRGETAIGQSDKHAKLRQPPATGDAGVD